MDKYKIDMLTINYIREKGFFDKEMAQVTTNIRNDIDNELITKLAVAINVDEEKVKKWAEMCSKLENIDYDIIQDIALKRKYQEMERKINDLKRENEEKTQEIEMLKAQNEEYNTK